MTSQSETTGIIEDKISGQPLQNYVENYTNKSTNLNILIIQTSPKHTASTLLVNALYGIIEELKDKKIFSTWDEDFKKNFNNIIVLKSHDLIIDDLIEKYKNNYEVYFVCSERAEKNLYIASKYKFYYNLIVFDYFELNETLKNTIPNIINNIYNKLHKLLFKYTEVIDDSSLCVVSGSTDTGEIRVSNFIKLNKESGIQRINNMNNRYNEIKNYSFEYIDPFYEIHGSHRNRDLNNNNKLHSLKKIPKLKF